MDKLYIYQGCFYSAVYPMCLSSLLVYIFMMSHPTDTLFLFCYILRVVEVNITWTVNNIDKL